MESLDVVWSVDSGGAQRFFSSLPQGRGARSNPLSLSLSFHSNGIFLGERGELCAKPPPPPPPRGGRGDPNFADDNLSHPCTAFG